MNKKLKDDLIALAILSPAVIGSGALFYWVFDWAWWVAVPAALASAYLFGVLLVALPFICWAIVGD